MNHFLQYLFLLSHHQRLDPDPKTVNNIFKKPNCDTFGICDV